MRYPLIVRVYGVGLELSVREYRGQRVGVDRHRELVRQRLIHIGAAEPKAAVRNPHHHYSHAPLARCLQHCGQIGAQLCCARPAQQVVAAMNQDQEPRRMFDQYRGQTLASRFAELARYARIDDGALRKCGETCRVCVAGRSAAAGSETVPIGHNNRVAGERRQGYRRRTRHEHDKGDA